MYVEAKKDCPKCNGKGITEERRLEMRWFGKFPMMQSKTEQRTCTNCWGSGKVKD